MKCPFAERRGVLWAGVLRAGMVLLGTTILGTTILGTTLCVPKLESAVVADGSDDLNRAIQVVLAIGHEGVGNGPAVQAMQVLNAATPAQIPELLAAMDQANPVAANYLRAAIESAQRREGEIPIGSIGEYLADRGRSSASRVYAFDLLRRHNAGLAEGLIPSLIDDPSLPLRRLAVKRLLAEAETQADPTAIGTLGYALSFARDVDQITAARDALAKHNIQVDLARQLGFVLKWQIVGPFDHSDEANFETALGPETSLEQIDLTAKYDGKVVDGKPAEVVWKAIQTSDPTGVVNLNNEIGKIKSAIAYAYSEFESAAEQDVVLKIGCINANKVWLNAQLVISEDVYHNGMDPDQFSGTAKLRQGKNQLLVKICQNDQPESWAQEWMFQVRICDPTGKSVLPAPEPAPEQ